MDGYARNVPTEIKGIKGSQDTVYVGKDGIPFNNCTKDSSNQIGGESRGSCPGFLFYVATLRIGDLIL